MIFHLPCPPLRVPLGSAVEPKRIIWWEPHWIPQASLSLLAGREGLGKSTIAVHWAARETRAGNFVIYLHSEDSREHTVVPRLMAAGADLDKVIFVDVETEYTEHGSVILPYDLTELESLIADYRVTFIVLDAATSAMSSSLSGKDDRQVRQYLEPLSQLAARHNIVILGLVHFGKRDGADSGKLILGSIAWSQVARSVLSVAQDPDSGDLVVTNTKGNLSPRTRSVGARIRSQAITIDGEPTEIGVIEWLGETTADARDYLAGDAGESNRDVDDWLKTFLDDSPQKATEVYSAADANGYSKDQIKRAKKRIGVVADRPQNPGPWFWRMPTVSDSTVVEGDTEQGAGSGQGYTCSLCSL
ncbi:MAG: AAA family ATPase [Pseudomonas sp.]